VIASRFAASLKNEKTVSIGTGMNCLSAKTLLFNSSTLQIAPSGHGEIDSSNLLAKDRSLRGSLQVEESSCDNIFPLPTCPICSAGRIGRLSFEQPTYQSSGCPDRHRVRDSGATWSTREQRKIGIE